MQLVFLYPKLLFLLLLVPFFILIYFAAMIYNKKKAVVFSNFEAMERFYDIEFFSKNFLALYINLAILILLILSIAGTGVSFTANTSIFSYVIAIDSSSSMSSNDLLPNRLEAAKSGAEKFLDALPIGVSVGVLSFSGNAVVLQVPTENKLKTKMAINEVNYGKIPGTNIFNALVSADKLFGSKKMKSVILISDGQLNVGDVPRIISYIQRKGLTVDTVAVGTDKGGVNKMGTVSKVDENVLKSLAFNSGGEFFRVKDASDFDTMVTGLMSTAPKTITIDLSFYLLFIAILILTLFWVIYNFRFKTLP